VTTPLTSEQIGLVSRLQKNESKANVGGPVDQIRLRLDSLYEFSCKCRDIDTQRLANLHQLNHVQSPRARFDLANEGAWLVQTQRKGFLTDSRRLSLLTQHGA
jgi:hypothetical protein